MMISFGSLDTGDPFFYLFIIITIHETGKEIIMNKRNLVAYLIAVAVVIVVLIIAASSCGDAGFAATGWALLPPAVAILLALISKEVYSSLFLGCLVGALLYTNFNPWNAIVELIGANYGIVSVLSDSYNMGIIAFLVMLGILVGLVNNAGGSAAFGRWAMSHVKTRVGAQLITVLLGVLIFIDDYFNCLTVGAIMRPITESHNISRAKLAYIIDATAAPVCMLAPVSSWAAAVSGYVNSDSVDGFAMFMKQIPFNYYCILTIIMIITIALMNIDFGPMLKHEYNAQVKNDLYTTPERPFAGDDEYEDIDNHARVLDLILPVVVLIFTCVIGMIYSGGFFDAESESFHKIQVAFGNADASVGLALGGIIAVIFAIIYFLCRRTITPAGKAFNQIPEGLIQMASPILVLTLAWTLCSFTRFALDSASFVNALLENADTFKNFLPAIIFILGCVIGFATGTSWGTIGIMAPIACGAFDFATDPTLCVISLAAACAGGVCGDHCSPISDTTIMASAGAHCYHLNHVFTQIPYAVTVVGVSLVSFIIAGFVQNAIVCLLISIVLLLATLFVIRFITKKKNAEMFAEIAAANGK